MHVTNPYCSIDCRTKLGLPQYPFYKVPPRPRRNSSQQRHWRARYKIPIGTCRSRRALLVAHRWQPPSADYLRPHNPDPRKRTRCSAQPAPSPPQEIRQRPQARPSSAMRVPGYPSYPDAVMEGCTANRRWRPRRWCIQPRLHLGLPTSTSRRGHGRPQNHLVCMWIDMSRLAFASSSTSRFGGTSLDQCLILGS